jgi:GDP/UDP-N,N'-diacetylbacillosamine 2-epimerase (hydrolysing)
MRKKICVITGSRAEYGLFYPLLKLLKKSDVFSLQLIVTGMHLSPEFGLTYREIEGDRFRIDEKVDIRLHSDTPQGILSSMGLALDKLGKALNRLNPDLIMVLGDRFEIFCAATAAHIFRIPVVHLYGGELSAGAVDEAFRHAITKMSQLHFTSTEQYRQRVIQLGENPATVFNVGALGIENIEKLNFLPQKELEKELNFKFDQDTILVTFHPVTLEKDTAERQFGELLKTLELFPELKIIFTLPNADTNGRIIIKMIKEFIKTNPTRSKAFYSLGRVCYLSLVKIAKAVVGNSSSGIVEAPSLGKPTINIGDRQKGRLMTDSVINCRPESKSIGLALRKALSPKFQYLCTKAKNPYSQGDTTAKIIYFLNKNIKSLGNLKKTFYDLKVIKKHV